MFRAFVLAAVLLMSRVAAAPPTGPQWRHAPEFAALFAPAAPPSGYDAYVTAASLETVLRDIAADPATRHPPGAWTPVPLTARDAFGGQGTYNPWTLARLYGASRPRVARGPRGEGGRPVESWTLISPHPDAALTALQPGTLLLITRIP